MVNTVSPADGAIVPAAATTVQLGATDQQNDPIQYQVLFDGAVLSDWGDSATVPWTPSLSQAGVHTLTVNVRDGFGGVNSKHVEVFVARPPVDHP